MTDSYIGLPVDGVGKKTRTNIVTVGSDEVHQQVIQLADSNGDSISFSSEAKQDTIISKQTELQSLVETLNELNLRLTFLSSLKQHTNESLRVTPMSSVSTAVTGPLTSAQLTTENNRVINIGNNLLVTQANINNCVGK